MAWTVPVLTQSTPNVCWEACAGMMWQWRHQNLDGYAAAAGAFATRNTGLTEIEMDNFYHSLGMRHFQRPHGDNLRHALSFSPVIFNDIRQARGHAMVATGFADGRYTIANPCSAQMIDFEANTNVCSGSTLSLSGAAVDRHLGRYLWYW